MKAGLFWTIFSLRPENPESSYFPPSSLYPYDEEEPNGKKGQCYSHKRCEKRAICAKQDFDIDKNYALLSLNKKRKKITHSTFFSVHTFILFF